MKPGSTGKMACDTTCTKTCSKIANIPCYITVDLAPPIAPSSFIRRSLTVSRWTRIHLRTSYSSQDVSAPAHAPQLPHKPLWICSPLCPRYRTFRRRHCIEIKRVTTGFPRVHRCPAALLRPCLCTRVHTSYRRILQTALGL